MHRLQARPSVGTYNKYHVDRSSARADRRQLALSKASAGNGISDTGVQIERFFSFHFSLWMFWAPLSGLIRVNPPL